MSVMGRKTSLSYQEGKGKEMMNRKDKIKIQRHKEMKLMITRLEVPLLNHATFWALLENAMNDSYDAGRLDKEEETYSLKDK